MKFKDFKFDKGWKLLIYFDLLLPAVLFLVAWITKLPQLSKLFHSYAIYIVNTIPKFSSLTGILGLLFHVGIIGYTIKNRNYKDMILCIIIAFLITIFFWFELNYLIIKPLEFTSL